MKTRLSWGLGIGAWYAGVYSLVAIGVFLWRGADDASEGGLTLAAVILTYFAVGLVGGAIVGLARPLMRRRWGGFAVGIIAAWVVFFGIEVATSGLFTKWTTREWVGVILLGLIVGPVATYAVHSIYGGPEDGATIDS